MTIVFHSPPTEHVGALTLAQFIAQHLGGDIVYEVMNNPLLKAALEKRYAAYVNRRTSHFNRVADLMWLADQEIPSVPGIPSAKIRELRAKLVLEETFEFLASNGTEVRLEGEADDCAPIDYKMLCVRTNDKVDLVEVVDGLADMSVVTTGTFIAYGVTDTTVLEEVDANNLRKFGPGGYKREDGKWMKPPDHRPPEIERVLRAQGWAE